MGTKINGNQHSYLVVIEGQLLRKVLIIQKDWVTRCGRGHVTRVTEHDRVTPRVTGSA